MIKVYSVIRELKVIPSIALRISTAHNFTRDQVISARALENGGFSLQLDLATEVNRNFLENE